MFGIQNKSLDLRILSVGVSLCYLLLLCNCEPQKKPLSPRINHVMLYVSDLDTSIDFYTNKLGLELLNRVSSLSIENSDGSQSTVDMDMAFLRFKDQDFVLEIAERKVDKDSILKLPTYQHLGIDVVDINVAFNKAVDRGAKVIASIRTVSANDITAKTAFIEGPDGELIEFMEMLIGEF